jgi:hypothetical protein
LPLDELLFFLVIPICAVLTLEAVRAVKGWTVGDEAPPSDEPEAAPEQPDRPASPAGDPADQVGQSR